MNKPLVSIIIPTYNSEKTLSLTLASIKRQTYKNIEVIVVDSYSKDRTVEIAKKFRAKVIRIRGERTKAKNLGLKHAKGKYVLFIDSDMVLTPRVVEECVKLAESNPRIGGIIIPEYTIGDTYWAKVRAYERLFYIGTPIESARFFKRELTLKVEGFDEDIVFYEEATLPLKLRQEGYKVHTRIKSYIIHIEYGLTLTHLIRKRYYYAKTMRRYLTKYGKNFHRYVVSQLNPIYRIIIFLRNRSFLRKPMLCLSVILLKSLETVAALIGSMNSG